MCDKKNIISKNNLTCPRHVLHLQLKLLTIFLKNQKWQRSKEHIKNLVLTTTTRSGSCINDPNLNDVKMT